MKQRTYKNFSDLRFLLKGRSAVPTDIRQKPLPRLASNDDSLNEDELFKNEMTGVNPLCRDSVPVHRYWPVEIKNQSQREESGLRLLLEFVQGKTPIDLEVTGEYVEGAPHPKGRFLLGYLRAGHYSVEAHLDLHGFDAREAKINFETFLKDCLRRGFGCVRVIHGRGQNSKDGQPILKKSLQRWLHSRRLGRHVVAYTSARLHDGGGGALYILLNKKR
jgi:DNA-nicking Smr family endonuclease